MHGNTLFNDIINSNTCLDNFCKDININILIIYNHIEVIIIMIV